MSSKNKIVLRDFNKELKIIVSEQLLYSITIFLNTIQTAKKKTIKENAFNRKHKDTSSKHF